MIVIVAKAVARVHLDAMEVAAENVAQVLRDKVLVGPKVKAASVARAVMVPVKAVQINVAVDLGAMIAAHCPNAAKLRSHCPKSTPPSSRMKRVWSRWRVR